MHALACSYNSVRDPSYGTPTYKNATYKNALWPRHHVVLYIKNINLLCSPMHNTWENKIY